jgi:tryptophan synthase alpha chain
MTTKSRLTEVFEREKGKGAKALVTFITAGFPDLESTESMIHALSKAGADIIELGIPFSDPMADGATIQASSEKALQAGTTPEDVLSLVKRVRKTNQVPIILFGYYNPIFAYGPERFARDAHKAGADGLLVVDLPPEESNELKRHTDRCGLDLIFLITPTSDEGRLQLVADQARGFVYFVAVTGVTGARKELPKNARNKIKSARSFIDLPIAIGFGISTPEQAITVSRWADGVIVGSAIIKLIEQYQESPKILNQVSKFVSSLKKAIS